MPSKERYQEYQDQICKAILILVKRSVFKALNDHEATELEGLLETLSNLDPQPATSEALCGFGERALQRRWDDPEAVDDLFENHMDGISCFGDDHDSGSETGDEQVLAKINETLPVVFDDDEDAPIRPEVPESFEDEGALDKFYHATADAFFALAKFLIHGDLNDENCREIQYHYTVLRVLDPSHINCDSYAKIYRDAVSDDKNMTMALEVENYEPSSEWGYDELNPSLKRTFFAEWKHWKKLSAQEKAAIKALKSPSENMDVWKEEKRLRRRVLVPDMPKFPKNLDVLERYNLQQSLEVDVHRVLLRAKKRALLQDEVDYLNKVLPLLKGHPSHHRLHSLVRKAGKKKLRLTEMMAVRAMAGDDDAVAETSGQEAELSILEMMIQNLNGKAEDSSEVLQQIQDTAVNTIQIYRRPIYHSGANAGRNPSTPAVYQEHFGNLATFLKASPPPFPQGSSFIIRLCLVVTPLGSVLGLTHKAQLQAPMHSIIVGVIHAQEPATRALLIWDVNILATERNKSKNSLHDQTVALVGRDRNLGIETSVWS
ncbi:hypothetical protein R3P38DRAFT_2798391 [Favolaschia claudopus]|uniref:Uncharacterized protein n=1 Tax=Favolaschia claudopus TaxID=2862362 RepID=A0AAW0A1I4_9AGAR